MHLIKGNVSESVDLTIKSLKSLKISEKSVKIVEAFTNCVEDPLYQREHSTVSILYEDIPSIIELLPEQIETEFIWITLIQQNSSDIEKIFQELHENSFNLLKSHTNEWQKFWSEKRISIDGNEELSNAIDASVYALASALPSLNTSRPRRLFYGLSPAGLGLNRQLEVYNGHSFWDTEIWMHPVILFLQPEWSKELLNYRHILKETAHDNAVNTSYKGYRYVWIRFFLSQLFIIISHSSQISMGISIHWNRCDENRFS